MSVTVTINAANAAELHYEMQMLLSGVGRSTVPATATIVKPVEEDNVAQQVAAENVAAVASEAPVEPEPKKERKSRIKKAEAAPVAAPETPAEEKVQDEADEAAEAEEAKPEVLTRENVRMAFGQYVINYGAAAAESDIKELLLRIYPAGDVVALSKIPDTQEDFAKVIAGAKEMLAKNPFKRDAVA